MPLHPLNPASCRSRRHSAPKLSSASWRRRSIHGEKKWNTYFLGFRLVISTGVHIDENVWKKYPPGTFIHNFSPNISSDFYFLCSCEKKISARSKDHSPGNPLKRNCVIHKTEGKRRRCIWKRISNHGVQ